MNITEDDMVLMVHNAETVKDFLQKEVPELFTEDEKENTNAN
jgi:hypothetical protein